MHSSCPCSFKTWNALLVHLSRVHANHQDPAQSELTTFSCPLCSNCGLSCEKDYFAHIGTHLKKNEVITCMFSGCDFQTNVYGTFRSHRNRKHTPYSLSDFKFGVVSTSITHVSDSDIHESVQVNEVASDNVRFESSAEVQDLPGVIVENFAAMLMKLEHFFHVPGIAVNEFLEELHFLLSTSSQTVTCDRLKDLFQEHSLACDDAIIQDIAKAVCESHPLHTAIGQHGPLSTVYRRKEFYKSHFCVVEPVEYILDSQQRKTFQYVHILKFLQQLLAKEDVIETILANHRYERNEAVYSSYQDGSIFRENAFLSGDDLRLLLRLYVDDFEVCNPLGTSRRTHKLCAVYWTLSNLPTSSHATMSSIFLAVLCKSNDVKEYGFSKILEPLLQDLAHLEEVGIFIPSVGHFVKGTVHVVIADNLGAHSIAGYVESFSSEYYCRFCTGKRLEIQTNEVRSGRFSLRKRESYDAHLKSAQQTGSCCFGVKKECVFSTHLAHFHVLSGYPPDVMHDVFEGVVPFELKHCLSMLLSKKYFTFEFLNECVVNFPYKWTDKTNSPHAIPRSMFSQNTIGGNAHENWNLIRLLPLLVGHMVPEDEPAWLVLMDLKDIVELVVSPVHTDESIAYLDGKISEHRQRFQEVFPDVKLIPKQHFLEHYPELIKSYGPLVHLWTMRFESKHSFFKQVARLTNCFKNIPLTLAAKHQLMISHSLKSYHLEKSALDVSTVSTVPLTVLRTEITQVVQDKYPGTEFIQITTSVTSKGVNYRNGMIVVCRYLDGLPEFAEIIQMCIVQKGLCFVLKGLCGWYREHFRAFELTSSPSREIFFRELSELADGYSLADYKVGGLRLVSLKRQIHS